MSNYRRAKTPGGSYFFTVVTYRRQPLLTLAESRAILRSMMRETRQNHPPPSMPGYCFPSICIASGLPPSDTDYSTRWGIIKGGFSKQARKLFHRPEWINRSKAKHRESTLWYYGSGVFGNTRFAIRTISTGISTTSLNNRVWVIEER